MDGEASVVEHANHSCLFYLSVLPGDHHRRIQRCSNEGQKVDRVFFSLADEESKSIDRSVGVKTNTNRFAAEVTFKQHNISSAQALAMSDWLLDVDARVIDAIRLAKERGFVSTGDAVIVVTGWVKFSLRSFLQRRKNFLFSILASGFRHDQHVTRHLRGLEDKTAPIISQP